MMYTDGMKLIEKAQFYLALGLIFLGFAHDITLLCNIGSGLFLGMSAAFFMAWKINFKMYKRKLYEEISNNRDAQE